MTTVSRLAIRSALVLGTCVAALALTGAAQARVFVGVGIGVPVVPYAYPAPVYAPPPVYYGPPPGYYAPPPAYYAPPAAYAPPPAEDSSSAPMAPAPGATPVAYGGTCYAGVYVCQAAQSMPVGSQCACPGLGAPSYGTVH
jgi:hypothetical protein